MRTTDAALKRHERVTLRILPGNHDEHSAIAVTWFLHAWYREDERVEIDTDPSEFWFHRFGKVMLAANHGHNAKLSDLPKIMATRQSRMWGHSDFRYGHGFHIHHRTGHIFEDGGAICVGRNAEIGKPCGKAGDCAPDQSKEVVLKNAGIDLFINGEGRQFLYYDDGSKAFLKSPAAN